MLPEYRIKSFTVFNLICSWILTMQLLFLYFACLLKLIKQTVGRYYSIWYMWCDYMGCNGPMASCEYKCVMRELRTKPCTF